MRFTIEYNCNNTLELMMYEKQLSDLNIKLLKEYKTESNLCQLKLNYTILTVLNNLREDNWNPEKAYFYIQKAKVCLNEVLEIFEEKPKESRYVDMANSLQDRYKHLEIFERHIVINTL